MILVFELLAMFIGIICVDIYVQKKHSGSKLLLNGLSFCLMGFVFLIFSHFFNAPVLGLLYGINPIFGSPDLGIVAGFMLIGFGMLLVIFKCLSNNN